MHALLVGSDRTVFTAFSAELAAAGFQIEWADTCEKALDAAGAQTPDLVVTDERIGEFNGLKCIKTLVTRNPLLNCAAVSSLSAHDFHEASEGLGVLMQLPPAPGRADARKLIDHLDAILNLGKKAGKKERAS